MTINKMIETEQNGAIVTLWLNRPESHNALNPAIMRKVIRFFREIEMSDEVRIVVIRGRGASFCAGADLHWMKDSATLSHEENLSESRLLSDFFATIHRSRKITIAIAHGSIFGGGNGLVSACDLAYGLANACFSLSETRLGLVAATISQYMLHRLSPSNYKELIFTARKFNGTEAEQLGMLNKSFETADELEAYLNHTTQQMLMGGPQALEGSKRLINNLVNPTTSASIIDQVPNILADIRVTDEAKEGFAAFIEKRKPNW